MVAPSGHNLDSPRSRVRSDRVLNRILDYRLKDKMRHFRCERCRFNLKVDREAVSEPDLFDLQVAADEFGFFLQRHQLLVGMLES